MSSKKITYKFYSSTALWYKDVIADIANAKKYIYIESFRIADDEVGQELTDALIDSHQRGVQVKILADWWGTGTTNRCINKMSAVGIEVRLFKEFVFASIMIFQKNHCRDHRKIIAIDDNISYLGSANFTQYSKQWRESILRMEGEVCPTLKKIFLDNFKIYNKEFTIAQSKKLYRKTIRFNNLFFIREVPTVFSQRIKKNYINLINKAQKNIFIESPYFLPGHSIYKALIHAVKRGVKVTVILPQNSDVKIADYVRDLFLEQLHNHGIHIVFFQQGNLHAKLLRIDDNIFSVSSANMDHRSFKYMFEIAMIGHDEIPAQMIDNHIEGTLEKTLPFDKEKWKQQSPFRKIIALIILPFSHLL